MLPSGLTLFTVSHFGPTKSKVERVSIYKKENVVFCMTIIGKTFPLCNEAFVTTKELPSYFKVVCQFLIVSVRSFELLYGPLKTGQV